MSARLRSALRWMPTFLGFPAGGLLAEVVGPVDAAVPALVGGAITGAVLGAAQWLCLRRNGTHAAAWIAATSAGMAVGLLAGASTVDYATSTGSLALQGAINGAIVGASQAAVLRPRLGWGALAWIPYLAGLWALGWTITSAIGVDVEARYTVFGSSGAIVVTAATSVLAIALDQRSAARTPAVSR